MKLLPFLFSTSLLTSCLSPTDQADHGPASDAGLSVADAGTQPPPSYLTDPEFQESLGSLKQALFIPAGYGKEGNGTRCSPPYSGGKCEIISGKVFRFKFFASSCPDWYRTREIEWWNGWVPYMAGLGYTVQGPTAQGHHNFSIRCRENLTGDEIGSFAVDTVNGYSCTGPSGAKICKYSFGELTVFPNKVEAMPGWANANNTQRAVLVVNIFGHESGHVVGLGHSGLSGYSLMAAAAHPTNITLPEWNQYLPYTSTEQNFLLDYEP